MTRQPIFLRPLTALTDEEEAAEVAEIVRMIMAARDAAAEESDRDKSSPPELDQVDSK